MLFALLLSFSFTVVAQMEVRVRPVAPVVRGGRPMAPSPRHVWIDGEWAWRGGAYTWVNGYWMMPRPSMVWVAGHWRRTHRGFTWVPGQWRRRF